MDRSTPWLQTNFFCLTAFWQNCKLSVWIHKLRQQNSSDWRLESAVRSDQWEQPSQKGIGFWVQVWSGRDCVKKAHRSIGCPHDRGWLRLVSRHVKLESPPKLQRQTTAVDCIWVHHRVHEQILVHWWWDDKVKMRYVWNWIKRRG